MRKDDVLSLCTIKSESRASRKVILCEIADKLRGTNGAGFRAILEHDSIFKMRHESNDRIVMYGLLAIYAGDIGTVPYPAGRQAHLERLQETVDDFGLVLDLVIYLTRYTEDLIVV